MRKEDKTASVKLDTVTRDSDERKTSDKEEIIDSYDRYLDVSASKGSCMKRHFGGWWTWGYVFDWLLLVGCTLTELAIMNLLVDPPDRYLPKDDPSVAYPYLPDIYPAWALIFPILLAIVVFALFQIFMRSAHDFHHAMLGLAEALCITLMFTDVVKTVAGRYRPDWLGREGLSKAIIRDGRESFPSGHSSISFAAMVYLSLYLAGKVGLFRDNGGAVWKAFLCVLPTGFSTAIAVTRVRDYHHNFSDILAGSILGSLLAIFAYMLNYHALTAHNSHLPKKRKNERPVYLNTEEVNLGPDDIV